MSGGSRIDDDSGGVRIAAGFELLRFPNVERDDSALVIEVPSRVVAVIPVFVVFEVVLE